MHLLIDAGNSRIKLAQYQSPDALQLWHFDDIQSMKIFFRQQRLSGPGLLSNVGKWDLGWLGDFCHPFVQLSASTPLPLSMAYRSPQSLGLDRRALAVAAATLYPNKNVLVLDAGTCLTGDFVDQQKRYQGGFISPGLQMRFKALAHYTAKLPQEDWQENEPPPVLGDSTKSSIISGVVNGLCFEIEGQIAHYQKEYGSLQTILTGGDAQRLVAPLKSAIFADPNFLLHGLDQILRYQLASL